MRGVALFFCPGKDELMIKTVALAVKPEKFRDKQTGRETTLWKVFVLADDGEVGAIYSANPVQPGNEILLGTTCKDGKLRLKLHRPVAEVMAQKDKE